MKKILSLFISILLFKTAVLEKGSKESQMSLAYPSDTVKRLYEIVSK